MQRVKYLKLVIITVIILSLAVITGLTLMRVTNSEEEHGNHEHSNLPFKLKENAINISSEISELIEKSYNLT